MKHVRIFFQKYDHHFPDGNLHIEEYEHGEWIGGSYATYDNLVEKVKEALEDSDA